MIENYREIPNYEKYLINEEGLVFSTFVNRHIKSQINTNGYVFIRFHKNGKQKSVLLHRLLMFVYGNLPSLDSELEVDHIDENKLNNSLSNLQVLTKEQHSLKTHGIPWHNNKICGCGNKLSEYNTSGLCKTCYNKEKINDGITLEEIIYWVTTYSWSKAGRELGLSDNGVRKRFTKLSGLPAKDIHSLRCEQANAAGC